MGDRADTPAPGRHPSTAEVAIGDPNLWERLRDAVLIALVRRAGGEITLPATEVDAVGGIVITAETTADGRGLTLRTSKRN